MNAYEHHAQARKLLAYLADTATGTKCALAYEGVLLELDRLVEPGDLASATPWSGNSRNGAYFTACEHLDALAAADGAKFQAALCRADLDTVWQREQAG